MAYDKSISDICSFTGLKEPFVRRVIRECKEILVEYFRRGDNNSILFDDNGLRVFDRVKQLKQDGASLQEIKNKLLNELGESQRVDNEVVKVANSDDREQESYVNLDIKPFWYNELKDAQSSIIEAKDLLLEGKQELILQLKKEMLLLSDGRTPEEIRASKELEEEKKRTAQELRIDRIKLIGEIKALEGRYFVGKKRLALLKKLEEIS